MPTVTITHNGQPVELLDVRRVGLPVTRLIADVKYPGAILPVSVELSELSIEYHDHSVALTEATL